MEKNTEKVFIITILEENTKGNGLTIKSMDMA
jgi:predicted RNA-binding protein